MILAAFFAVLTSPHPHRTAAVDVLELNHVVGDDGQVRFTQVILWRWYDQWPMHTGHHVAQWMMVREDPRVERMPTGLRTRVTWRGGDGKVFDVSARTYRETWTRHDPEQDDQECWKSSDRRAYFCQ